MMIDLAFAEEIVNMATKEDLEVEEFPGTLLDNYLIHNYKKLKVNGKSPDFIIIKVVFLSSWSSGLELILTDSKEEVEEFVKWADVEPADYK